MTGKSGIPAVPPTDPTMRTFLTALRDNIATITSNTTAAAASSSTSSSGGTTTSTPATVTPTLSMQLSNAYITLGAYSNGTVQSFSTADGQVKVLYGNTDVTASATLTSVASGCTGQVNTADNTPVAGQPAGYYQITALSGPNGTLTISAVYDGITVSQVVNITSVTGGIEIVSVFPTTNLFQGRVVFYTADNQLYRYNGTSWVAAIPATDITGQVQSAQLADLAITTAKFANGLQPVQVVSVLPAAGVAGRVFFLTADNQLYRDTGSAWTLAVPAVNVTGQLTSGQLGSGSVGTSQIAAGAVTAAQIASGTITAAQFASGLQPVQVVSTLPAAGTAGRVCFLTTDNQLYRDTGSAWTLAVPAVNVTGQLTGSQIAAGAIGTTQFASGLQPITVVSSVPTVESTNTVFNTADGKLYRWNGTAYVATVPTTDLTGTVTGSQIAAGAVTAASIAANTITAGQIAAAAIGTAELAAGAVTAATIASGTITATQIASGTITASQLAANSVTATQIAANAITAGKIAAGAVVTAAMTAGTINGDVISAGTIAAAALVANSITASQIASATITGSEIAAGTITASNLAANSVTAGQIAAGAVTTSAMNAGTINGDIITAGTLAAGALVANSITASQIAAATITGSEIAAGTITGNNLVAGTVTAAEMNVTALSDISANIGTITAGEILFDNGTFMLVQGLNFGGTGLILWYGPHQASVTTCTTANAIFAITTGGSLYVNEGSFNGAASGNTLGFSGDIFCGQEGTSWTPASLIAPYLAGITFFNGTVNVTAVPSCLTPTVGNSSTQIANTAFVNPGFGSNTHGHYRKNADGSIEQWGTAVPNGGSVAVTFPVPYTTLASINVQVTPEATTGTGNAAWSGISTTGFSAWSSGVPNVSWHSIGY